MSGQSRTRSLAVVAGLAAVGFAGAVTAVSVVAAGRGQAAVLDESSFALVNLIYLGVAVLICVAKPGHLVGRIALAGTAATAVSSALVAVGERGLIDRPGSVPGATGLLAAGLAGRAMAWIVLVSVLPLVFPDGVLVGSPLRQRISRIAAVTSLVLVGVGAALGPEVVDTRLEGRPNAWGLPHVASSVSGSLSVWGMLLAGVTTVLALAGFVTRWRTGNPLLRQQLLWFGIGFALPILFVPLFMVVSVTAWAFALLLLPVPVALFVAMRQHQLYDVQLVASRTLTWVGLSAAVAVLYAVTVGGVGAMLRQEGNAWVAWLAAGVVAVSFAPLRNALQSGVDRMVYGRWSQAADVLAETGRRLADASDVSTLLRSLTDDLGVGLGLSYVEISDSAGSTLASYGAPNGDPQRLPLTAYGEVVGQLTWSGHRLRDSDRQLLDDLARQVGGIVHSSHLVEQLRRAQERLVLASEDERRRLRRDLHDGLGPALAGLTLQVDTVRNVLGSGQVNGTAADAEERLLRLRSGIQSTVFDVRRIVEGLRPPALDELGLVGAVRELAHRLTADHGCTVDVRATPSLPRLAAAVEVAAYRVTQEALTNVIRHSGATECHVEVASDNRQLCVQVRDNGSGDVQPRPGGVGLSSMHERATEIGGTLDLHAVPGVGTTVALHLPLGAAAAVST